MKPPQCGGRDERRSKMEPEQRVVVFVSKYEAWRKGSHIVLAENVTNNHNESPFQKAVHQFENSTSTTYEPRLISICTGFSFAWHDSTEVIHPYLFMLDKLSPIPSTAFFNQLRLDTSGLLLKAFSRCDIPSALSESLFRLQSDHTSGAGQLCNIAVKDFASLVGEDKSLVSIKCPDEWWDRVRLYAWHIARNGRPSMGAVIITCIVRALEALAACKYMLGPKSPAARAQRARKIVLECVSATRKRWSTIPTHFEDFVNANYFVKTRPLTILLHSCSSVIASSLVNLFAASRRPPIHLLVLESRPKFEGVAFAKHLNTLRENYPRNPPVSIEVATDSSVAFFSSKADLYLLAADRIYPSGDVSNKIGCLSAALCVRYYGKGKTIVVSTTDKVCGGDERGTGFEENDAEEVSSVWGEKNQFAVTRNVYFETVPHDLIDLYLTERGLVDLLEINEVSQEQTMRESAAFEGI